jgi:hypothetical protein
MSASLREEAFTLAEGTLEVELWRDLAWSPDSTGDPGGYGRVIAIADRHRQATGMEVRVDGRVVSTAVVLGEMGCPGISTGNALLRGDTLLVAMAATVVALALPSLEVRWMTHLDDACLFGLMEIDAGDAVLVHGEMSIRRLGMDGRVRWERSGADIFTGGCWIEEGQVVAEDWNGATYRWRLADGEVLHNPPPPLVVPDPRYGRAAG